MDPDKRSAWLRQLDEECPYQVVLPREQLSDDSEILKFLTLYVGRFDMYVEDEYAAFVRYCFEDPLDAAIFRSRFEKKAERFKLEGGEVKLADLQQQKLVLMNYTGERETKSKQNDLAEAKRALDRVEKTAKANSDALTLCRAARDYHERVIEPR